MGKDNRFTVQQAQAMRTCHYCGGKIPKDIWSLNFHRSNGIIGTNGNICEFCVGQIYGILIDKNIGRKSK